MKQINTEEYRNALAVTDPKWGTVAYDWIDKPHRLVYDLCNEIDRLRSQMKTVVAKTKKTIKPPSGMEHLAATNIKEALVIADREGIVFMNWEPITPTEIALVAEVVQAWEDPAPVGLTPRQQKAQDRLQLRCSFCPPNRGENASRKPKHESKPKRKNKR